MVIETKTSLLKSDTLARILNKSTCMDCIFWYQCRQGKIDCSVKPKQNADRVASF